MIDIPLTDIVATHKPRKKIFIDSNFEPTSDNFIVKKFLLILWE